MVKKLHKQLKTAKDGKRRTGPPDKLTPEIVIEAVTNAYGLITVAAKALGVERKTMYNYIEKYPEVKQAVEDAREAMLDFAESKLFQKIRDNDSGAIFFFLKCKGKARGYVERQEVTGKDGETLVIKEVEVRLSGHTG